jgi:hypothetical protein
MGICQELFSPAPLAAAAYSLRSLISAANCCTLVAGKRRLATRREAAVNQNLLCAFALLTWVGLTAGASVSYAQDKQSGPKVELDLDKPAPAAKDSKSEAAGDAKGSSPSTPGESFGKTCRASAATRDAYKNLDEPAAIADLIGAPIAIVRVRRVAAGKDKVDREEVRKQIIKLLNATTEEVSRYAPWDEPVPAGLVATIQFFDHSKGVLEESGGHVCFSDYSGLVWWTKLAPDTK